MALIHCNFFSKCLGIQTNAYIILPEPEGFREGDAPVSEKILYPALYLLHGQSDNYTGWQRRTSIERYVAKKNLAVIMPDANRSFYQDLPSGYKYFKYLNEELPFLIERMFPVSPKREHRFVAGLSMGGYGAFKLGLTSPEKYGAIASLSGALNFARHDERAYSFFDGELQSYFKNSLEIKDSASDLFYLCNKFSEKGIKQPAIYQCCGTEDALYKENQDFFSHAKRLGLEITFEESQGEHNWIYWDKAIQEVLNWLPIND
jgi:putative tributyrin esterase